MTYGRSLRGAPRSASSPGRLTAGARPEIDDVLISPSADCLPRATLLALTCEPFIQSCGRTALGLLHVGNRVSLPLIAGDRLRHVRRRSRNFGLNARLLGGDLRGESPERLPCVGLLHPLRMEHPHGKFFTQEYA
jgi:hypothetical protein